MFAGTVGEIDAGMINPAQRAIFYSAAASVNDVLTTGSGCATS